MNNNNNSLEISKHQNPLNKSDKKLYSNNENSVLIESNNRLKKKLFEMVKALQTA